MSFFEGQSSERKQFTKRNWRDTFVQLNPGIVISVRIIEPDASDNKVWKHFIPQAKTKAGNRGITIPCPGIGICPICARNREIKDRNHPDYIKASLSYYVHVLDLTPTRICPLCGAVNTGKKCTYDDADLRDVVPTTESLKLLEGSKTLFSQLDTVERAIVLPYDPERPSMYHSHKDMQVRAEYHRGEEVVVPVGITGYPLQLSTSTVAEGRRLTTPIPAGPPDSFNWEDYKDRRISKWDAYLNLESDEIVALTRGGALVDILKARRSEDTKDESSSLDVDDDNAL